MDETPFRQIDLLPQGQTQGSGSCRIRSLSFVENRHGFYKVVVDVFDRTDNAYDLTVCIITCQSTNTKQSKLAPAVQLIPSVVEGASRGQTIVGSADNSIFEITEGIAAAQKERIDKSALEEDVKNNAEKALKDMGLTMSAAITMFLVKVGREKRIPFEINADPFYSAENIAELERRVANLRNGSSVLKEHELIEVDDE